MGETPADGSATTKATAPRRRRPRHRRTIIIVVSAVVVAVVAVTAVALALRPRRAAPSATSATYTVERSSLTRTVSASGTFEPVQQLSVSFPASGTVTDVKVSVGDRVTRGQVLATQDSAALAAALQSASAAVDSAQAQVNALTSAATTAQRTAAQAALAADRAKLSQAQANYDGTTLTSPIAGIIATVSVSKGGVATGTGSSAGAGGSAGAGSGGALAAAASGGSSSGTSGDFVVVDTSSWRVNASVGAADLPSLKAGQSVTMTAPDGRTTLSGSVHSVSQVAEATSASSGGASAATFPVVVDITDTKGAQLFIGSTTTVSIAAEQLDNVLAVPSVAIIQSGGHPAVRVEANGTTTDRAVTLGPVIGQRTVVTEGLNPGDTIQVPSFGAARGAGSPSAAASGQRGTTGGPFGRGGR
ncbi:efflux RND transporter periplasmic adaptor subunit [Raineyella sp.]|uniref:efflux RND transporter periplasmic adaptor subunit n=1 Tax=Raineyella sp. TaxID=1911550 RepID=UPI002B210F7A|nr:biotin/lipoyl-binding protein [Raineyella sp.]MEA5154248.1 efflux RND transporter periplasmic adaptor subunit [Raineyella sp.]